MADDDNVIPIKPKPRNKAGPGRGHKGVKMGNGGRDPGASAGPGWGGAAKGNGSGGTWAGPEALTPGNTVFKRKAGAERRAAEAELAAEAIEKLAKLMRSAQHEGTQFQAASKLLDRIEGMPVQRQVNADLNDLSTLSDEELENELARLRQAAGIT